MGELIRFVVGPDDLLVPDTDAKAEGRGVWVTLGAASIAAAVKKNAFAKSLKTAVRLPDDLPGLTQARLEQRLLGALGMARKAGQLLTGATKVKSAIEAGDVIALITASDGAADGREKMLQAVRGQQRAIAALRDPDAGDMVDISPQLPHFEMLTAAQLGLALGQENVIHAALTKGAAAQSALARAERLARYIAN